MTLRGKLENALLIMRRQRSTGESLQEPIRLVSEVLNDLPEDPEPGLTCTCPSEPVTGGEPELSPEVRASVERGLKEAFSGKLQDLGSFASFADDVLDDEEIGIDDEEEGLYD